MLDEVMKDHKKDVERLKKKELEEKMDEDDKV